MRLRAVLDPRVVLGAAIVAYGVGFTALSILRHRAFTSGRFDLGNMVQAVWATANGDPLRVTSSAGDQFVRLGAHVDPLLVLFAPLWWVWPSPSLLLTAQAVGVALGALPLYAFARRRVGEWAALGFALAYLLSPGLQWMTLADFHPVALATPLILVAIWALDADRLLVFVPAAVLAAAGKEHVAAVLAGIGVWYALAAGRRWVGGAIAAAGVAWSAVAIAVVVPRFSPQGESPFHGRYDEVGGSPGGILRTFVTDPLLLVREAFDERGLVFLLHLLAPLAFLPLGAPLLALAAAPELAVNLLSSVWTQTSIRFHYEATTLAVFFAAAALAAGRTHAWSPRLPAALAAVTVTLSLAANYALGPLPLWRPFPGGTGIPVDAFREGEHGRIANSAIALVPGDAVVSASNSLGAHLSARRRILIFPVVADAEWVVIDLRRPGYVPAALRGREGPAVRELRRDPSWESVFDRDGIVIFRRAS